MQKSVKKDEDKKLYSNQTIMFKKKFIAQCFRVYT